MQVDVLKLKSLMAYNQVTQADLANALGVSRSTITERFKKPQSFTFEEMNKIIKFLKIENPSIVFFA